MLLTLLFDCVFCAEGTENSNVLLDKGVLSEAVQVSNDTERTAMHREGVSW